MNPLVKGVFKGKKLCYSISEANRVFRIHFAKPASPSANGRLVFLDGGFNVRWRRIPQEELSASVYSSSKVCLIGEFCIRRRNDYVRGNQFGKVVHNKAGKDFLVNVLHFFCVEMKKANGVLEFTERGFDTPTHTIEIL